MSLGSFGDLLGSLLHRYPDNVRVLLLLLLIRISFSILVVIGTLVIVAAAVTTAAVVAATTLISSRCRGCCSCCCTGCNITTLWFNRDRITVSMSRWWWWGDSWLVQLHVLIRSYDTHGSRWRGWLVCFLLLDLTSQQCLLSIHGPVED